MANRFRLRFTFWLDLQKADEAALAEAIDGLKHNRTFASAIRDGIRLICDLRAGQTTILLELFPWVKEALQPVSMPTVDRNFQEQITRLETLFLSQGHVPIEPSLSVALGDQPPQRTTRKSAKPRVEVTGLAAKASAETVAKNFLSSMKNMASGFFD